MNALLPLLAAMFAVPFAMGTWLGFLDYGGPALPGRQSDLDPVVELVLRFSEERSVERRERILGLLARLDRQRISLRFMIGIANDTSVLPVLRRKAIATLIEWDSKGAMSAAAVIVGESFDRSVR